MLLVLLAGQKQIDDVIRVIKTVKGVKEIVNYVIIKE